MALMPLRAWEGYGPRYRSGRQPNDKSRKFRAGASYEDGVKERLPTEMGKADLGGAKWPADTNYEVLTLLSWHLRYATSQLGPL